MRTIKELKKLYLDGINITNTMRAERNIDFNTSEIIEIAYDIQSGEYQKKWAREDLKEFYDRFTKEIADIILNVCRPTSILEAGVGEATTFVKVLKHLNIKDLQAFGFDISWSRILFAKKLIEKENLKNVNLITGNLFDIPFLDNSIDLVYTFHSIEPNGGSEKEILKELFRITKNYLVLFEPNYDETTENNQKRMDSLGYIKGLKSVIRELDYELVFNGEFKNSLNEKNPTAVFIIKKNKEEIDSLNCRKDFFACPISKSELIKDEEDNIYFSKESLVVYPIIKGIPCLRKENAILASKYEI
jgi:ubiquinone/menaquinone biosynthesis C-methylase UbiE